MALTLGSASLVGRSGQGDQLWTFNVILDGAATTTTGLALPTNFPNYASSTGPYGASGTASKQGCSRIVFMPGAGGSSAVVSLVKCIFNSSNPDSQLDVSVSAAGTNTQTVQVLALIKDQGV